VSRGGAGGAARAAYLLALGLAALALAPAPGDEPCAAPGERAAAGGWSREVGCAGGGELRGPARLLFGRGVDPNLADLATLEALPGIGPARAAALARARESQYFCGPADLARVKGIGPKTREALAPWLEFEARRGCSDVPWTPIHGAVRPPNGACNPVPPAGK
jgi:helix-hairpin-helix protein